MPQALSVQAVTKRACGKYFSLQKEAYGSGRNFLPAGTKSYKAKSNTNVE